MDTRAINTEDVQVPKRVLHALLSSLEAGVVPRLGAPYIAIGREAEVHTMLDSLELVASGGASLRFLIGRYGSGKSFLMQLLRGYALERGFLCADADLSPERRLSGGNHTGLATYRELMKNLSSKASPDGGALTTVLSRHYSVLCAELAKDNIFPESHGFASAMRQRVFAFLSAFESNVGGFDFSRVLGEYYMALSCEDAERKSACMRWLRGEYATKSEAKQALGFSVSSVIQDENWCDYIKLWALFSSALGYCGFIMILDECVNLYKIPNRISRENNYEKLLSIFNDTLQGRAKYLGILFGGTPQFLEDPRRGLYSYEALRSRLTDGRFADAGYVNFHSPVVRLRRLSDNEFLALIARLTKLHAQREGIDPLLSPEEMVEFLQTVLSRAGSAELATPREIIRDYLGLLNILRSNPQVTFAQLLHGDALPNTQEAKKTTADPDADGSDSPLDFSLKSFEF